MESRSSRDVITDECKMPEASKGFSACSSGRRQGRSVRMCLKADRGEVRRNRCYSIHGPIMEYKTSTKHKEK